MGKNKNEIDKDIMYSKIMPTSSRSAPKPQERNAGEPLIETAAKNPQPTSQNNTKSTFFMNNDGVSFRENQGLVLLNLMEPLVVDRLDAAFTKFNCCRCDKCKKDVAAIALNKLIPKYIVTAAMDIPKLTAKYTGIEVATAIVQAIIQVRSNPRH